MAQEPLFNVPGENPVFSVSEFLDFVNEILGARDVSVQGEILGAKPHPTGFYFSVKDTTGQQAVMDCYLSPFAYRGLGFALEDGMVVRLGGIASIYKARGRFSFRVETVALAGEGSLKKAYEALKKKLTEEGLFERKRALPQFVKRIALITSRTGAVIDDFRTNLAKLGFEVVHADARVEGAQAPMQVRSAIERFNAHAEAYDVLVLIRGGGSMEDLQAFNDEYVVRAVFGSKIPTLVSIGHDRDVPLAQMAADATASTPTATAHLINGTWEPLQRVPLVWQQLMSAYETLLASAGADVRASAHRLTVQLTRLVGRGREYEHLLRRALESVGRRIASMRDAIASAERHLVASDPSRLLRLGYSIVADESGAVVRNASQLAQGQVVTTRLADGSFKAEVKELQS